MGEYVKYKGEQIKIGTCEELYYVSYGKYISALNSGLLGHVTGNSYPEKYALPDAGFLFRFPFPDEDKFSLGDNGNHSFVRGLSITIPRGEYFPKGMFGTPINTRMEQQYKEKLLSFTDGANPNNHTETIDIEIVHQKLITRNPSRETCLCLVIRCPFSGELWELPNLQEAQYISEQIRLLYFEGEQDFERSKFWASVFVRILDGYRSLNQLAE